MDREEHQLDPIVLIPGIIIPVDWDTDGVPIAFVLSAFDEMEYRIGQTPENVCVEEFTGEKVVVEGRLIRESAGAEIHIQAIKIV